MWFAKFLGGREDDSEPAAHPVQPAAHARKVTPTNVRPVSDKSNAKPKAAMKGFDPYNSGGFDKNKAWERVIR